LRGSDTCFGCWGPSFVCPGFSHARAFLCVLAFMPPPRPRGRLRARVAGWFLSDVFAQRCRGPASSAAGCRLCFRGFFTRLGCCLFVWAGSGSPLLPALLGRDFRCCRPARRSYRVTRSVLCVCGWAGGSAFAGAAQGVLGKGGLFGVVQVGAGG
jgi:hypothetical protein